MDWLTLLCAHRLADSQRGGQVVGYLVAFPTQAGSEIIVEVDEAPPGTERVARRGEIPKLDETVDDALGTVKSAANAVLGMLDQLTRKPEEATVEFGVKLSAKAGAVIVSADAEAHLTVTLKWAQTAGPAAALQSSSGDG